MPIDTVLESPGFPVNELGEIVAQVGVGTSNIVGTLPSQYIPVDAVTGKMVVAGLGGGGGSVSSSVPFDPVTAFASGAQVIYAGSLYQFTSAHTGQWTGADVTYLRQEYGTLNTIGMYKPLGEQSTWTSGSYATSTTTTPTQTRGFKIQVEAQARRARIVYFNKEAAPVRGWAASLAWTEREALGTISDAVDPVVGGTAYNVLASATNPYGFNIFKFGGSQRCRILNAAGVSSPSQGYYTNKDYAISDWLQCTPVANASGNRPMVVMRMNRVATIGDAASNLTTSNGIGSANSNYATDKVINRLMYAPGVGSGDQVTDPTLDRSGASLFSATTNSAQIWVNFALWLDHGVPTRNIVGVGDSVTEGYQWWQRAAMTLSTQAAPVCQYNLGISTNQQTQYIQNFLTQLRGENAFTDVIISTMSLNENPTQNEFTTAKIRRELLDLIAACRAKGVRVYLQTSYAPFINKFTTIPASVTAINAHNTFFRNNWKTLGVSALIDVALNWDNPTMISGDGIHPSATGIAYMQGLTLTALQGA